MENNGPVRRVISHRRRDVEALRELRVDINNIRGVKPLCELLLHAVLAHAVSVDIVLDVLLGLVGADGLSGAPVSSED